MSRSVFIVDGSRTPFLKARSGPGPFTPVDLAVQCGRPLLARQPFAPDAFDQVILGCVNVIADEMNPARVAALRLGMGEKMVAFTVQINCGSGMQSIDTAYRYIREGVSDLILAGGAEALSHAPLVWPQQGVRWFAGFAGAKGIGARIMAALKVRPSYFKPVIGLERGLTDPITELNMGQTAEVVGHLFGINRAQSDAYAAESHKRLANAQTQGWLKGEVETAFARDGKFYDHDDGVRPDSTTETQHVDARRHRDLGIERGICDPGAGLFGGLERRKILQGDSGPRWRGRTDRPDQDERRWRRDQPWPSRRLQRQPDRAAPRQR